MNLQATLDLSFGGPGSGPNAPCPQCGPKSKEGKGGSSRYHDLAKRIVANYRKPLFAFVHEARNEYYQKLGLKEPIKAERAWTEDLKPFDLTDEAVKAAQAFAQVVLRQSGLVDNKDNVTLYRAQIGKMKTGQVSYSLTHEAVYNYNQDALEGKGKIIKEKVPVSQVLNITPFVGVGGIIEDPTESYAAEDEVVVLRPKK